MYKELLRRTLKWVYSMILEIILFMVNKGPPGPGFKKTSDGSYGAEDKKLTNLHKCAVEKDAANKKYVDDILKGVGNLAPIGKFV